MARAKTKVFMSNTTQAVRLPKAVALPKGVSEVEVISEGNRRIITPATESWDSWFKGERVTNDFMSERLQELDQTRDDF